jgi:TRAP-type C4-dicarboxylate transport system permease small subunit
MIAWLDRVERGLCIAAFAVLAALLFADVLLREILGNGIAWAHQAGVYANLVIVLAGMGLATSAGAHLRPRFADHWLPQSWRGTVARLGHALTALVLLFFAGLALHFALETRQLAETATVLRIPLWPLQFLLVLSFASSGLRNALYALRPKLAPETA